MVSGDESSTSPASACSHLHLPMEPSSKAPGVLSHVDASAIHGIWSVSKEQSVSTNDTTQEHARLPINTPDLVLKAPTFSYNVPPNSSTLSGPESSPVHTMQEVNKPSSSQSSSLSFPLLHFHMPPRGCLPAISSMAASVPSLPITSLSGGRGVHAPSGISPPAPCSQVTIRPGNNIFSSGPRANVPAFNSVVFVPGPPGITPPDPRSQVTIPSGNNVSSAVPRANMPAFNPVVLQRPNHDLMPNMHPPNHSLSPLLPPQGSWLQPEMRGGLPRLPFVSYPAIFSGPVPLAPHGMPLPSIPLPDSQPPGVTPVVHASKSSPSGNSISQPHSISQPQGSFFPQEDIPPSGDVRDSSDNSNKEKAASGDELTSWTAHKTDAGAVYFYNALTGESTYKKPVGLDGEMSKISVQSTPVSWEKIDGTDWALVSTNDGKRYYCNKKTKQSTWDLPNDIADLKRQAVDNSKGHSLLAFDSNVSAEALSTMNAPAASTGGRDATSLQSSCSLVSTSALDLIKKKLQDPGAPATSSSVAVSFGQATFDPNSTRMVDGTYNGIQIEHGKDRPKDVNGDVNLSEGSSDSEDGNCGHSKELCVIQFKEMLKERGIAPFSKWEKELPRIVFDPRFKAVPGYSTRRSLFEHYVKTRAEEERKEKRAAQKAAVEAFKQLLVDASKDITVTTDYHTFKRKWGGDLRFLALDRKEKEFLLNESVLMLKRAAEEKTHAQRSAAVSTFKSMLEERGDISVNSRWSKVRDSLRSDARYRSVQHEDREIIFNQHISELKAAEQEAEQAENAKRVEQEKMKERERELRKRKEREEQEMDRVRLKVRRKEAIASYQALLVETIRDQQASWTESKPKLEKDPQGRAITSDLDQSDMEKLFREHVKTLHERCLQDFRSLLWETITTEVANRKTADGKTVLTSWSAVKELIKPDARYSKTPRKDREALWLQYAEEMERKLAGESTEKTRDPVDSTKPPASRRR